MDKKSNTNKHRISKSESLFVAERLFDQSPKRNSQHADPSDSPTQSPSRKKEIISLLRKYFVDQ